MIGSVRLLLNSGAHVGIFNFKGQNALSYHGANYRHICEIAPHLDLVNRHVLMLLFAAGEMPDSNLVERFNRFGYPDWDILVFFHDRPV